MAAPWSRRETSVEVPRRVLVGAAVMLSNMNPRREKAAEITERSPGCQRSTRSPDLPCSRLDTAELAALINRCFAELAQLVERRLAKAKVAGSNPVFRSIPIGPGSPPGPPEGRAFPFPPS